MLLLPSLKPTLHAERDPRGDTLLSPQLHLLLLTVCGLPPFKWQDLGVSLPIGRSSSHHSTLLSILLLPTQVQKFLLGLKNNLPSTKISDKKWPAAPYKCFNAANRELQQLFYRWKVRVPRPLSSHLCCVPPSSEFPLLPPSSTFFFFFLSCGETHITKFTVSTILKYTVWWHSAHSHCLAVITTIHLRPFIHRPKLKLCTH